MQHIHTVGTKSINIAAAVLAHNFRMERRPMEVTDELGRRRFVFFFKPVSEDGKFQLGDIVSAWHSGEEHVKEHPEEGISYIVAYKEQRHALLNLRDGFKKMAEIRDGEKIRIVALDAAPEDVEILMKL